MDGAIGRSRAEPKRSGSRLPERSSYYNQNSALVDEPDW